MRFLPQYFILPAVLLGACAHNAPPNPPVVGGDRDAHGCIPSAGYTWCASTQQCEQPWVLAKGKGFENSAEAFNTFCGTPTKQAITGRDGVAMSTCLSAARPSSAPK